MHDSEFGTAIATLYSCHTWNGEESSVRSAGQRYLYLGENASSWFMGNFPTLIKEPLPTYLEKDPKINTLKSNGSWTISVLLHLADILSRKCLPLSYRHNKRLDNDVSGTGV